MEKYLFSRCVANCNRWLYAYGDGLGKEYKEYKTILEEKYLKEMFDCLVEDIKNFKDFPSLLVKSFKRYIENNVPKFTKINTLINAKKMTYDMFLASASCDGYGLELEHELKELKSARELNIKDAKDANVDVDALIRIAEIMTEYSRIVGLVAKEERQ